MLNGKGELEAQEICQCQQLFHQALVSMGPRLCLTHRTANAQCWPCLQDQLYTSWGDPRPLPAPSLLLPHVACAIAPALLEVTGTDRECLLSYLWSPCPLLESYNNGMTNSCSTLKTQLFSKQLFLTLPTLVCVKHPSSTSSAAHPSLCHPSPLPSSPLSLLHYQKVGLGRDGGWKEAEMDWGQKGGTLLDWF